MKKFFSLLCALTLVLSVSAAPMAKHATKSAAQFGKQVPAPAKVERSARSMERVAPVAVSNIRKAPAAAQDAWTVDYAQFFFIPEDMSGEPDYWQIGLFNGKDLVFGCSPDVLVDETHIAGTYDLADAYGYWVVSPGDTLDVVSGTMTIACASNQYTFAVSAVLTDGSTQTINYTCAVADVVAVNYLLYYYYMMGYISSIEDCMIELDDAPFIPTGETIELVVPGVSILTDATAAEDGWFEFSGTSEDGYFVVVDIISDEVEGTFGNDQIDYKYTFVVDADENQVKARSDDANEVIVYQDNDTMFCDASFMAKDGNIYHVVMKYYIPTPTETVDLAFDYIKFDLSYAESDGIVGFAAAQGEDYEVSFYAYIDGEGDYTFTDVLNNSQYTYIADYIAEQYVYLLAGDFTVGIDEDGLYTIEGSFICSDEKEYTFTAVQPAPLPAFDATIAVSAITGTGATITVTPATSDTYFVNVFTADDYAAIAGGQYASYGITSIEEYVEYIIAYAISQGATLDQLVVSGTQTKSPTGLKSSTDYVAVAVAVDAEGKAISGPATEEFTTDQVAPSSLVLGISYDGSDLKTTASNNDEYFYWVETKSDYDKYQSTLDAATVAIELQEWIDELEYEGYLDYYTMLSGAQTLDPNDFMQEWFSKSIVDGEEYIAMVAPCTGGVINGTAAYCVFTAGEAPMALKNIDAEVKAVKAIRNGQLVIEKNGVKFNVMGAKL